MDSTVFPSSANFNVAVPLSSPVLMSVNLLSAFPTGSTWVQYQYRIGATGSSSEKWCAKENPAPTAAASCAL